MWAGALAESCPGTGNNPGQAAVGCSAIGASNLRAVDHPRRMFGHHRQPLTEYARGAQPAQLKASHALPGQRRSPPTFHPTAAGLGAAGATHALQRCSVVLAQQRLKLSGVLGRTRDSTSVSRAVKGLLARAAGRLLMLFTPRSSQHRRHTVQRWRHAGITGLRNRTEFELVGSQESTAKGDAMENPCI